MQLSVINSRKKMQIEQTER